MTTITSDYLDINRGRTAVRKVMLGSEQLDVTARTLKLDRGDGQHDMATLALTSSTLTTTDKMEDRPISFTYGSSPRTEMFYGYISSVSEEQVDSGQFGFTITAMGPTAPMGLGRPRFWANKTIPSVVRDLAYIGYLGYKGDEHTHTWRSLAQTSESDWQQVLVLSARIGYAILNSHGVVRCVDPVDLYYRNAPYVRLVSSNSAGDVLEGDRKLLEFEPTAESTSQTYEGAGIRFAYLSDGKPQWAKQIGYKDHRFVSLAVRDFEEANVYLKTIETLMTRWKQVATARINGDASIYPGMCVEIVTTQREYRKKYDGKWLVAKVTHQMDAQAFQTQLSLARPDHTQPSQITAFSHFWTHDTRGKPSLVLQDTGEGPQDPQSGVDEYINALRWRWVSSWNDRRARAVL